MVRNLFLLALLAGSAVRSGDEDDPTRRGGPRIDEMARLPDLSPTDLMAQMFEAIDKVWLTPGYERAGQVEFRVNLDGDLPRESLSSRLPSGESIDFDIGVEGIATPNGRYRMDVSGELGEVEMVHDLQRTLVVSRGFKSFSDTPERARSDNDNLTNYRSYMRRYLGKLRAQLIQSGTYRSLYAGTGSYEGSPVDVVRFYKPSRKRREQQESKAPMPLRKLWTFWHDGGYEFWLHSASHLPAAVFYTNVEDNVFANFTIDYDERWLPTRIVFRNNSLGAEGEGDLVFQFDNERMLSGISLKFDGNNGVSLRFDAVLSFAEAPAGDAFRIIPPFGFKKLNRDHLKLMLMTQVSGGLLKLKKYGVKLKNFKF